MYQDYEVLSFEVDYDNETFKLINKLEHFDKAPYSFSDGDDDIDKKISRFFNTRTIPEQRIDYHKIMEMTGCKNSFVLSFKYTVSIFVHSAFCCFFS